MSVVAGDDANKPEQDDKPVPLTQAELNNLTRDLNFSKCALSFWHHISNRNICWHQEQRSTGIKTVRKN